MDSNFYSPRRERRGVPTAVWVTVVTVLLILCVLFFFLWQLSLHQSAQYVDIDKINEVLSVFDHYSIKDTPSKEKLTDAMLAAALAEYGDRYAAYYTVEDFSAWQEDLSGSFCGIGVLTLWQEGQGILLLDVFPDSPAEAAGLVPGDLIVAVEGQNAATLGQEATMTAIAGKEGTSLSLTVKKASGETVTVSATRAKVTSRSVLYRTLGEDASIGYVRITDFNGGTYEQFKAAVYALEAAGVRGIVFDLRDNGGGTLLSVSQMLAFLLPDGNLCYVDYAADSLEDDVIRSEGSTLYYDGGTEQDEDFRHVLSVPVTVLINGNTASAAELFTSALRDYGAEGLCNVKLAGQNSYGKGTMQTTYPLVDGTGFKLTVAHYDPPCHINYDGVGIAPDPTLTVALSEEAQAVPLYLLSYEQDTQLQSAVTELWQRTQP